MIKLISAALLMLLALCQAVFAGDAAERRIIGFSPDGKWFAFEQFGVQDGSGFPYHDIFVTDLASDKWAPDTPVRVRIDSETATQHQARNSARIKAAPTLAKLKIIDRGRLLASNPVTELTGDAKQIRFHAHLNLKGLQYTYQISLDEFDAPAEQICKDLGAATKAFALSMSRAGNPAQEVYRDQSIPKSRHCALNYTIADVVTANANTSPNRYVVLVHVFSYGFEGPDTRFIAIPVTAP